MPTGDIASCVSFINAATVTIHVRLHALTLLTKIIDNVLEHGNDQKYRSLNAAKILERIGAVEGAERLLLTLGFAKNGTHFVLPETHDRDALVEAKRQLVLITGRDTTTNSTNSCSENSSNSCSSREGSCSKSDNSTTKTETTTAAAVAVSEPRAMSESEKTIAKERARKQKERDRIRLQMDAARREKASEVVCGSSVARDTAFGARIGKLPPPRKGG